MATSLDSLTSRRAVSSPGRRWYLAVVGFHLLTRLLTLLAIGYGAQRTGASFPQALLRWDGRYYRQIAESGYPNPLPVNEFGQVVTNATAFFPLLPFLTRPLLWAGLPFWLAAALLALALSSGAAVLIGLVVRHYASDRVALVTACLWSAFPTASVLSVPYTESIFTCLAAATLLMALSRRWALVALLGALCAFSRPTGVIVVGALGLLGLYLVFRERAWRPLLAAVVSGLGVLAAFAVIGWSASRWDAWFITEREGWRLKFDGGASLVRWMYDSTVVAPTPFKIAFCLGVVGVLVLGVIALLAAPPLVVAAYLALGLVMAVGQGGQQYLAQLRYVLPLFPLLVPVAVLSTRLPRPLVSAVLLGLAVTSALVGLYYFTLSDGAP